MEFLGIEKAESTSMSPSDCPHFEPDAKPWSSEFFLPKKNYCHALAVIKGAQLMATGI
jgi:hypothetical protein